MTSLTFREKQSPTVRQNFLWNIGFMLLVTIFLLVGLSHQASASTAAENARVASVLFGGKETYQDYNLWGNCPYIGYDWCVGKKAGYDGGHSGIDIQTKTKGTETFYSVSKGKVIRADGYGTIAVYDSSRNITVLYLHASKHQVKVGDDVWVGKPLGNQGDYGATGAFHVHLEARNGQQKYGANGKPWTIDPVATALSYINGVELRDFWRKADPIYSGVTNGFDAQFKLYNGSGKTVSLEAVYLSIHDANGNFIKDMKKFPNVSIANGVTWQTGITYTNTTYTNGTALPAGTYRVVAKIDENSNGYYDGRHLGEQNFTVLASSTTTKPNAPTGLTATASSTSISLKWTNASTNESGFRVYRWNGSSWSSLATLGVGSTSYTNSGLSLNTTYYYYVCSYNSAGESCSANYVSATTSTSGSVPGSVSVNPASGSWTSSQNLSVTSGNATTIYYTMVNTYDGSTPYDPSTPSASNNNGYLSGSSASFSYYGSSGQLKKTKLRFVGCNNYGCGPVSSTYTYSIDQRSTVTKPATPGSQSASATSSSSITVRWSDLSSNESGFRVYRWNGSAWTSLTTVGAGSTSYINSGLSANTTYYYYVCSYNTAGESCPGNGIWVQATTSGSSGSAWDGVSPSGTACEADATTVATAKNSYGKVELRWSNSCKTNWARVIPNSSSYSTYGKIRRTSDGRTYSTSGTGARFTAMVYAPSVQACASGTINGYSLSEVCR